MFSRIPYWTMEKAMAPHSSTLAWKIPWKEEPGRLQSMGSPRVGHDWATSLSLFTFMHWRRKWQPTPVFLPGESQGRGSLVGCRLWGLTVGHDWSDLAACWTKLMNAKNEQIFHLDISFVWPVTDFTQSPLFFLQSQNTPAWSLALKHFTAVPMGSPQDSTTASHFFLPLFSKSEWTQYSHLQRTILNLHDSSKFFL